MLQLYFNLLINNDLEKDGSAKKPKEIPKKGLPSRSVKNDTSDKIMLYETAAQTTKTMITIARQFGFTPETTVIGELCEGKKAMTKVLEATGYTVVGRDKYFFNPPHSSFDIFSDPIPTGINLIFTNPPSQNSVLGTFFVHGIRDIVPKS